MRQLLTCNSFLEWSLVARSRAKCSDHIQCKLFSFPVTIYISTLRPIKVICFYLQNVLYVMFFTSWIYIAEILLISLKTIKQNKQSFISPCLNSQVVYVIWTIFQVWIPKFQRTHSCHKNIYSYFIKQIMVLVYGV